MSHPYCSFHSLGQFRTVCSGQPCFSQTSSGRNWVSTAVAFSVICRVVKEVTRHARTVFQSILESFALAFSTANFWKKLCCSSTLRFCSSSFEPRPRRRSRSALAHGVHVNFRPCTLPLSTSWVKLHRMQRCLHASYAGAAAMRQRGLI